MKQKVHSIFVIHFLNNITHKYIFLRNNNNTYIGITESNKLVYYHCYQSWVSSSISLWSNMSGTFALLLRLKYSA
jgi:hypothetical protein